jgi:hypothetical protein
MRADRWVLTNINLGICKGKIIADENDEQYNYIGYVMMGRKLIIQCPRSQEKLL